LLPVVVVLLVLLVGGGSAYVLMHGKAPSPPATVHGTATSATTGTPGAPAGFRRYTDSGAHVQFVMPNDWTTTGSVGGSSGLILVSPDETSYFLVGRLPLVGDNVGAASGALTGAAGSSGTVANKVGPTQVSLAGTTWIEESADVTRDGLTVHMVVLVTTHSGATYLLGYYAPSSSYAEANTRYFQPIVHSFTFLA
jgi:hypothetical protein